MVRLVRNVNNEVYEIYYTEAVKISHTLCFS